MPSKLYAGIYISLSVILSDISVKARDRSPDSGEPGEWFNETIYPAIDSLSAKNIRFARPDNQKFKPQVVFAPRTRYTTAVINGIFKEKRKQLD